jgi:hypothetical protein
MTNEGQKVVLPHNHCPATYPSHPDRPCAEWVQEFEKQGRAVAGGGLVAGRIAKGGLVAARSVSDRAVESMRGVHRCADVAGHVERLGTQHTCGCHFEWTDAGPVAPPEAEAEEPR